MKTFDFYFKWFSNVISKFNLQNWLRAIWWEQIRKKRTLHHIQNNCGSHIEVKDLKDKLQRKSSKELKEEENECLVLIITCWRCSWLFLQQCLLASQLQLPACHRWPEQSWSSPPDQSLHCHQHHTFYKQK